MLRFPGHANVLSALVALTAAACSPTPTEQPPVDAAVPSPDAASVAPPAAPPPAAEPIDAAPSLAIDGEGMRMVLADTGRTVPIVFGTDRKAVLQMLAFRGPPGTGTNTECGAGPLDYASWPDGLTLQFQDGDLVGWALDGRGEGAVTTMSGIGIGSTRAELDAAYSATVEETTLGQEFAAGDLHGILDGAGKAATITNMWAGTSCNFR
ncbi:hypothetical protein [Sphingomonas japonica]|uniref:DUF306 domain-containing protein n=2 Tax=Sphingomonas japonica TaxID=511662 RepID=A0ABX0TXJ0_9SPHN|nr:hypothetical protein [Sphingomonas japonica]NIJ23015.1 hypothetical protein [Sphingomonas japonica]